MPLDHYLIIATEYGCSVASLVVATNDFGSVLGGVAIGVVTGNHPNVLAIEEMHYLRRGQRDVAAMRI